MKRHWWLAGAVVVLGIAEAAIAKPREVWTVVRTSDPITGASTCTVSAYDRSMFGGRYSRTGYLYPIVERNSQFGLLVGVSSGGAIRVPSGNVVWRVDDRPFRTLRSADNPPDPRFQFPVAKTGNAAVDEQVAQSMKSVSGMMSTSTVASGKAAEEMLAELVAGRSLIYRAEAVAPAYGLPSDQQYRVGQLTGDGRIVPIAIDDSFRRGLEECGIQG